MSISDVNEYVLGFVNEDLSRRNSGDARFRLLVPSLTHIASFKVALTLWNEKWSEKSCPYLKMEKLAEFKNEVFETLPLLRIPKFLKEKLYWYIDEIGQAVTYNSFIMHLSTNTGGRSDRIFRSDFGRIIWTPRGTIDPVKTLQATPENYETLIYRNKMLSWYGLENKFNKGFRPRDFSDLMRRNFCMNPAIFFDRNNSMRSLYRNCDQNERRKDIVRFWLNGIVYDFPKLDLYYKISNDVCFFLANLSPEMLKEMLSLECAYGLLDNFLWQPFHEDYFLQTITLIRNTIPNFNFAPVRYSILRRRPTIKGQKTPLWKYKKNLLFWEKFLFLLEESTICDQVKCFRLLYAVGKNYSMTV